MTLKHGFLGAGRVATALSGAMAEAGREVGGFWSRTPSSAEKAAASTPGAVVFTDPADLAAAVDMLWITTSDNALEEAARRLWPAIRQRQSFGREGGLTALHCSGAFPATILREEGARYDVAGFHPILSFPTAVQARKNMPGAFVGIEATGALLEQLKGLATDLGMRSVAVTSEGKALYHAAACAASNYTATLMAMAGDMAAAGGMERAEALQALIQLTRGTLENVASSSPEEALTGPIARGDSATVERHLAALETSPELARFYRGLGLATVEIALRGALSRENAEHLRRLMEE